VRVPLTSFGTFDNVQPQLLRSAISASGEAIDVVIDRDGMISAVGTDLGPMADDTEQVDLSGRVLLPAATEPHAHLDKAFLAEVIHNPTGDLIGAIEAMRTNRHLLTVAETADRAERAARRMAANGVTAVRTHADVTIEHGLTSIEALLDVRKRVADVIDIEIVALCGWPVTGRIGADQRALLRTAMQMGADLVGGVPHLERISGDGTIASATDVLLEIADDHRRPVDLHTDETLDPAADGLDRLAQHVLDGFDLPVTASHCVSLGQQSTAQQTATSERVAAAGINVVALPHTNLFLQGRGHVPMPRALTAVDALQHAGVNVCAGADNLQDPFNPVGRACPFETAGLMILTTHLLPADAWATVSTNAARALRGDDAPHGVVAGARADLLSVPAETAREAIANAPADRWVWRGGHRRVTNGTPAT
jgi:cytosine deaminase